MHLGSPLLPRQSTNIPLDNGAPPKASAGQALNLKGIHREKHGIAEQIRIMNELNARLVQHLTTNNSPPTNAPVPEDANRSCHSHQSGDRDSKIIKVLVKDALHGAIVVDPQVLTLGVKDGG